MRICLSLILAAFVALCSYGVKADEKITDIFANVSKSVGALYKMEVGGDMSFLCSVTAIGKHEGATVFLTAFHCVNRGVSYRVTLDGQTFHAARVWKIPGYEADKQKYPRAYHEPETDMALFLSDTIDAPVVETADIANRVEGTDVVMVGFPLGVAKISYKGIVSGTFDRPGSEQDGYQLLQIFGSPGNSGSSVIDVNTGKVISVLVSARQARAGLPVIFATPIEYQKYLREVPTGKEKEVGEQK